jgi:hypothetical protein
MNKLLLRKYFCIYPLYTRFFILPILTLVLFGMWFWGMMEISCAELVHSEKVLRRVNEETNTLRTVKSRKANWIGHILSWNCLLKRVELFLHTFIVLRLSDSMDEVKTLPVIWQCRRVLWSYVLCHVRVTIWTCFQVSRTDGCNKSRHHSALTV